MLIIGICGYENGLASAPSHLSRFTVVETSPVNEELQKNFSDFFMQHFTTETCTGKESFEQARISIYHFYMRHIRAAINFLDLALELGRQPLLVALKNPRNWPWSAPSFVETQGSRESPGSLKDRERHDTGGKDEKSVNGTQIFHRKNGTNFSGIPFISGKFPVEQTKKSFCPVYIPTGISGIFW